MSTKETQTTTVIARGQLLDRGSGLPDVDFTVYEVRGPGWDNVYWYVETTVPGGCGVLDRKRFPNERAAFAWLATSEARG